VALPVGLDVQVRLGAEARLADLCNGLAASDCVAHRDAAWDGAGEHVHVLDDDGRKGSIGVRALVVRKSQLDRLVLDGECIVLEEACDVDTSGGDAVLNVEHTPIRDGQHLSAHLRLEIDGMIGRLVPPVSERATGRLRAEVPSTRWERKV
jgi:hypothetical protein